MTLYADANLKGKTKSFKGVFKPSNKPSFYTVTDLAKVGAIL